MIVPFKETKSIAGAMPIDNIIDHLVKCKEQGANTVRFNYSQRVKGMWEEELICYQLLTEEESKQNRIEELESQLKELKK